MSKPKNDKTEKFQKAWAQIIAKAWSDELFKQRLLKNPTQVLQDYGIEVAKEKTIKICENTAFLDYLVLPAKPEGSMSEEHLRKIAGGNDESWCCYSEKK